MKEGAHPMRLSGPAARLTILVDEADQWHHKPLYVEIVHRAHRQHLAGATALRGLEGFAGIGEVHTGGLFTLGQHLPVLIIIVDSHQRITAFIDSIDDLMHKGIALVDDVQVIAHRPQPQPH
jgi:PII-like signaling protein